MRLSRRRPPTAALPAPPVTIVGRPADLAAAVEVEDQLEPRVRLPADILRCITACIGIALLVGLALLAKATAKGVEIDLVYASRKVATGLTRPLYFLGYVALLSLPVVIAIRLILRAQLRRLTEAAVIGLIAAAVTMICNVLLGLPALADLLHDLGKKNGLGVGAPLDVYLAALVAYITVIGLSGRTRWRTTSWAIIAFYCLVSVAASNAGTSVLTLLITLLIGRAVGAGLRYAAGTQSERPTALEIASALSLSTAPVIAIRRIPDPSTDNRRYQAVQKDGHLLDVTVFDRDQQTADAIYQVYRNIRLRSQVSRPSALTVESAIEHRALMTYAVEDAGAATPRLRALLRVGPEAAVLATDHRPGMTLAEMTRAPSDQEIGRIFDAVLRLHEHRVTHRSLTADHIVLVGHPESVVLLDPGAGDVAASDLQVRLDLAQLTATLALLVGPDRAADTARAKLGDAQVEGLVPLLQPVVLHRSTRAALRRRKDLLPALRKRLVGSAPASELPSEQLERIRPRTLVTMLGTIFAAYIILAQLSHANFAQILKRADWRWVLLAVALTGVTYVGATWSLSGFVLERLNMFRTYLAQLAGSFVTLVTPAAVGGVALNLRYLHKADVEPADAAASVGVSQVFAFALHLTLLVIFAALTGSTHDTLRPPGWVWIALGALAAAVLVVLSFPAGRRLARSRLAPALGQVIPRLLDVTQRPDKLAEGIGGAFLVTGCYILALAASVLAVGGHAPLAAIAVVFLTGNALGSAVPTPGGIGAVEAALTAGLKLAGLAGGTALSAVLLFRLITFWLPVPVGWVALNYLQRHDAI